GRERSMTEVVTMGETMMALRAAGMVRLGATCTTSVAGAESTVGIGLSRLGHHTRWASRIGRDEPGQLVLRTLRAENVDVSTVEYDDAPTGLILFEERLPDLRRVQYYRAGSAGSRLNTADATAALTGGAQLLHLTGITPALGAQPRAAVEAAVRHAHASRVTVSFDINFRSRLWDADDAAAVLAPLARQAHLVIGSADELELVGGAQQLLAAGVGEVVTKLGTHGASTVTAEEQYSAPGHRVPV